MSVEEVVERLIASMRAVAGFMSATNKRLDDMEGRLSKLEAGE